MEGEKQSGLFRLRNFVKLTDEESRYIENTSDHRGEFAAHDTIYDPEGSYTHLVVIESGWAERFKILPDGRKQILNFHVPGDILGMGHCLSHPDNPIVSAITSLRARQIPIAKIAELVERFPRLAMGLMGLINRETLLLQQQVLSLGRRSALEAMMHLLLELQARLKLMGLSNGHYVLPLTQNHLADCLGLSSVHVNRTLTKLRADGLIAINGRQIVILDQAAAEALADFDVAYLR